MAQAAIIVHGGAWNWPDEQDIPKRESLIQAVMTGWRILENGGSALDAVECAVNILEDAPLFDAGTGSHLNAEGVIEMDALIVDGTRIDFGAVAAVTRVRNPISLARRVMQETKNKLFVGAGADRLAEKMGIPLIANVDLITAQEMALFHSSQVQSGHDTVGAVAIDQDGNIAAATSTGGTPFKLSGRVGDSPIFGAGAYADSQIGAASATGVGENSMRALLSKYAVDQIAAGYTAQQAADRAMEYMEARFEPSMVGIIVVDRNGNIGFAHTTPKIGTAWIDGTGAAQTSMGLKSGANT